jgi:acyl-CoA thioester hydrolase
MDAYGHVNHANIVTLLEEARVALVFTEAARQGITDMSRGMVVVKLAVHYRAPLVFDGGTVDIEVSVRDLKASSFMLDYVVRTGGNGSSTVATTAETLIAAYDVDETRPHRLTDAERDFLAGWHSGGGRG